MKTMNHVLNAVKTIAFCAVLLFSQSCSDERESRITQQEEQEIADNSSSAEVTMDEDIQAFEDAIAESESAGGGRVETVCVEVIKNEEAKTITLDFGEGCVGPYGRERSGKVIITYSGTFGDNLANRVITFEDYFVNDKQITGKLELRDFNVSANSNLTLTRKAIDYAVHFPNGNTFTLNGSTTIEWLEGEGDFDRSNNVLMITGSYTGVSSRGRNVSFEITEPVIVSFPCGEEGKFLRVDGKTELRVSNAVGARVRTVDYGDGDCDETIVVTINDRIFTITLL